VDKLQKKGDKGKKKGTLEFAEHRQLFQMSDDLQPYIRRGGGGRDERPKKKHSLKEDKKKGGKIFPVQEGLGEGRGQAVHTSGEKVKGTASRSANTGR